MPRSSWFVAFALIATAASAHAQVAETWRRNFDVSSFTPIGDDPHAMAREPSGGAYVVGRTQTTASGGSDARWDAFALRYDAAGNLLWSDIRPGARTSYDACDVHPAGGIVAAGDVGSPTASTDDVLVSRYDAAGTLLWSTTWSATSTSFDEARAVRITPAGETIVVGRSATNALVMKLDANGAIVWVNASDHFPGSTEIALDVDVDALGRAWVTGVEQEPFDFANQFLLHFDAAGALAWARNFGGPDLASGGTCVRVDASANAYVGGRGGVSSSMTLHKLDAAGTVVWSRTATQGASSPRGFAEDVELDAGGRPIVVGGWEPSSGNSAWHVRRYDASGVLLSATTLELGNASDFAQYVALDAAGDATIAGYHSTGGNSHLVVARFGRGGDVEWTYSPPTLNGAEAAAGVVLGPDGAIYSATKGAIIASGVYDVVVVRLDASVRGLCFGDGSGTVCPCGNSSSPGLGEGCASSFGYGGLLNESGAPSLASDSLVLHGSQMSETVVTYFQGDTAVAGGAGAPFGDGLRCAGGAVVRLGARQNVGGASQFPGPSDPSVSAAGLVTSPGAVRVYQVWYRNAASFCTSATFNVTNAIEVTWQP